MNKKADKSPDFARAGTVRTVLPLVIAGIAIILFSTAGLARMMGWGPDWTGNSGDFIALDRTAPVLTASESRAPARCPECGELVSVREIKGHDEGAGPDAEGAAAGNGDGIPVRTTTSYELTVRMADGSIRVIDGANSARWRTGERLIVIDGTNPSYP